MLTLMLLAVQAGAALPAGSIAYVSGADPDTRVVCVVTLPERQIRTIGHGRRDGAPKWSPGGAWIAYNTNADQGVEMRIVRPDGAESRTLSSAYAWNEQPRWSPDGTMVAYAAGDGLQKHIMVYDLATGQESQWGANLSGLWRPVWLPRNELLVLLTAEEDAAWLEQLFPTGADGYQAPTLLAMGIRGLPGSLTTDIMLVTEHGAAALPHSVLPSPEPYEEWAAEPAPDGRAVAFESNDGGDREIFVLTHRGAANVSNHPAADWNPVWSPDGRGLVFESFRDGHRGIYRVSRDSVRVTPIAVDAVADCWAPTWSPDGQWIAYVSNRTGNPDIFAVHLASGETLQITDSADEDLAPDWAAE
jgi:Tol biopolymer transport system component